MEKESIVLNDVTVFLGEMLKTLPEWRIDCKHLGNFKYLLVDKHLRQVVAGTTGSDRLHLFQTYRDYAAQGSSTAIPSINSEQFFVTRGPETWVSKTTGKHVTEFVER